jgi:hypothetical protein
VVSDKVLSTVTRHTADAESVSLALWVPHDAPCDFGCAAMVVGYRIDVEFLLAGAPEESGKEGGGSSTTPTAAAAAAAASPLAFSIPMQFEISAEMQNTAGKIKMPTVLTGYTPL